MAIKLEVSDNNERRMIVVTQRHLTDAYGDNALCLTVREAKALLAKLPAVIERAKKHKPRKWNGKEWV